MTAIRDFITYACPTCKLRIGVPPSATVGRCHHAGTPRHAAPPAAMTPVAVTPVDGQV